MPSVPDASSMTTFRRVAATVPTDPTIKSRTFVAPIKQGYLSSIVRASEVRRWIPGTVLSLPSWKSPQFNGRIFLK